MLLKFISLLGQVGTGATTILTIKRAYWLTVHKVLVLQIGYNFKHSVISVRIKVSPMLMMYQCLARVVLYCLLTAGGLVQHVFFLSFNSWAKGWEHLLKRGSLLGSHISIHVPLKFTGKCQNTGSKYQNTCKKVGQISKYVQVAILNILLAILYLADYMTKFSKFPLIDLFTYFLLVYILVSNTFEVYRFTLMTFPLSLASFIIPFFWCMFILSTTVNF